MHARGGPIQSSIDFAQPAQQSAETYRLLARRELVLRRVAENVSEFRHDFADWLAKNMGIWERFESQANTVWDRGRPHYSARTIIEWMRHETNAREVDSEFKINGNYVPDMARLYGVMYPDRVEFFETRGREAS
jgi:hypothetical protein